MARPTEVSFSRWIFAQAWNEQISRNRDSSVTDRLVIGERAIRLGYKTLWSGNHKYTLNPRFWNSLAADAGVTFGLTKPFTDDDNRQRLVQYMWFRTFDDLVSFQKVYYSHRLKKNTGRSFVVTSDDRANLEDIVAALKGYATDPRAINSIAALYDDPVVLSYYNLVGLMTSSADEIGTFESSDAFDLVIGVSFQIADDEMLRSFLDVLQVIGIDTSLLTYDERTHKWNLLVSLSQLSDLYSWFADNYISYDVRNLSKSSQQPFDDEATQGISFDQNDQTVTRQFNWDRSRNVKPASIPGAVPHLYDSVGKGYDE